MITRRFFAGLLTGGTASVIAGRAAPLVEPAPPPPLTFRTSGAWGAGKGSALTAVEVDANFHELWQALEKVITRETYGRDVR